MQTSPGMNTGTPQQQQQQPLQQREITTVVEGTWILTLLGTTTSTWIHT